MKSIITNLLILVFANAAYAQTTWTEISTPTNKDLKVIQFVSDQVGFVCGDSVLLKTMDGGATWSEMMLDSIPNNINQTPNFLDMHWFDENHGLLMAGPWGGFYETLDGGMDWEYSSVANSGFCQSGSLFFFDDNNGFAGGAGCFSGHIIDRFENGTWSTTNYPNDWDTGNLVTSIEFRDSLLGFAGTYRGTLLRTEDAGLNWDTISSLAGDSTITDFIFYPDGTIRATHQNNSEYGVMISTDEGLTWEFDNDLASFFYPSMNAAHINENGATYIAGQTFDNTGIVFDNSGTFWHMIGVDRSISDIASHTDSVTFLVGDSGAIYVNVNPITLGVSDDNSMDFNLSPNPATTQIQIRGIEGRIKGYSIMEATGRALIQSDEETTQDFSVDISGLAAGAYLVLIETSSGVATNRFVKH